MPLTEDGAKRQNANYIDRQTLESLIEDYLHTELHFDQARAVARALVEQLRARNFILCYLGADSYAFVHRTFLEYFCAAEIVHQFNVAKTLSEPDLIALFDAHCRDDDWREVLRLICGQIDEQFVGRIVERLATRTDFEKWGYHTYLPELALAALSFMEARNLARLDEAGGKLFDVMLQAIAGAGGPGIVPAIRRLLDELIEVIESVGSRWPGVEFFRSQSIPKFRYSNGGAGQLIWARLIVAIEEGDDLARVTAFASNGEYNGIRVGAIQLLAEKWPDETTRELLAQRAVQDDDEYPRRAALQALAEKWPDETTRELHAQRAVQDDHEHLRSAALQALAENWPDETARELLTQRAVHDDHYDPRRAALQALAEKWPDETTLELLEAQIPSLQEGYYRSELEKSAESLRKTLRPADQTKN